MAEPLRNIQVDKGKYNERIAKAVLVAGFLAQLPRGLGSPAARPKSKEA